MARKCDTAKYRKRRIKERQAHSVRVKRRQRADMEFHRLMEASRRYREEQHRRDPRTQLGQRLVNALAYRLNQSPLYRIMAISAAINECAIDSGVLIPDINDLFSDR